MHVKRILWSATLAVATVGCSLITGCADRRYTRVNDPYYGDYHRWTPQETVYYQQWETERHYDHRDYAQRNADQQKDYWQWRHNHNGSNQRRDRDHDHDHDQH